MSKDKAIIPVPSSEPWKVRGHRSHKSGAGFHSGRKPKRKGNRSASNRKAIRESSD